MNNATYTGHSFSDIYFSIIKDLLQQGVTKAPRGQAISHIQNCFITIEDPSTVFSCPSRPYNWDYLNKELTLYFDGERSAQKFSEASKFWDKLKNADGTINSAYGYRLFYRPIILDESLKDYLTFNNQWNYVKYQLTTDKDSRQAIAFISGPDVQYAGNKDFICTLTYTFDISDNKLNLTVNRRSQDLYFGIPYDFAWEYLLMTKMVNELKEIYPELEVGTYTLFCNNIHIYERNFDIFTNMLNDFNNKKVENIQIISHIREENIEKINKIY